MHSIILNISFIVLLNTNLIIISKALFVEVGEYPKEYLDKGLNNRFCGLRYAPIVRELTFDKNNCFRNKYPNKTVYDIFGAKLHRKKDYIETRIRHGSEAQYGESPFTVRVSLRQFNKWLGFYERTICTGVLLTSEWVLTAAHCITKARKNGFDIFVFAGINRDEKRQEIYSFANENYLPNEEPKHDIGLVKVSPPFSIQRTNQYYKYAQKYYISNTLCLPNANQTNPTQESATFFGYGIIDSSENLPKNLKKAEVFINEWGKCYEDNTLCSLSHKPNDPRICEGDSGGGLVQYIDKYRSRAILIGLYVASRSNTGVSHMCTDEQYQQIYVPVSQNIHWILKKIREN